VPLLHIEILVLKNTKMLIFGGISKFCLWADFGKFWQFWAVLGKFCYFDSGWEYAQTWAKILKTS
jgi:hypothetical protein